MLPTSLPLLLLAAHLAQAQPIHPPTARTTQPFLDRITPAHLRATVDTLASFGTRHTLSDTTSATRGIGAARNWIKAELDRAAQTPTQATTQATPNTPATPRLQVAFESFDLPAGGRVTTPTTLVNVVAVLPGTMPEAADRRYYVVGHYDSMPSDVMDPNSDAPGANDDASGTAAVIEIARALADARLDATLVFLCTAGEEQGLLGAKYHADSAKARNENIAAVLSNDIVGDPWGPGGDKSKSTPHLIRVFSEGIPRHASQAELTRLRSLAAESDSPSRQLARYIADVAKLEATAVQPMLVFRPDRFLRGGDHSSFNEAGFPAVRFTEVHEDYRHQHQTPRKERDATGQEVQFGDLPEFVDAEYLANVAKLNAATLIHLASAPRPPANARVITAKLEYSTTLRWDKCPEPDTAGYEVVWRDTTSATWQFAKDVGNTTEATIDESKDNFFFGARAYDKEGHKSPVTFATANRE